MDGGTAGSGTERVDVERVREALARARSDLADLREEFAGLADPSVQSLDDEHDSEGATIGFERARVAGLIVRTERLVDSLESAALRVSSGHYGSCAVCGRPIGADRLEALPGATACMGCARSTESVQNSATIAEF